MHVILEQLRVPVHPASPGLYLLSCQPDWYDIWQKQNIIINSSVKIAEAYLLALYFVFDFT